MLGERGTHLRSRGLGRLALVAIAVAMTFAALASAASATMIGNVKVLRKVMAGGIEASPQEASVKVPGVGMVDLDKVGIIKIGPKGMKKAKNVLVLEPGTSAAAAYFVPFAKSLVEDPELKGQWQVWAVERRENFLENQKELTSYKRGEVSSKEFFDYYLGYLGGAEIAKHYEPVANSAVEFTKEWGMNVAVEDLKVVIDAAKELGGKVVLGGHSLGGSVVTAYATWDFAGKPGAEELAGLVYDDGGSSPLAMSKEEAETALAKLNGPNETPWLAFGGIPAPDLGLFSATGSALSAVEPKGPSQLEGFAFLPPDLRSPITPVTNEAGFGYSVNVGTSPESLAAAQIHGGAGVEEVAEGDGLHGWNGTGALTPVSRYSEMLSGLVSGTALPESGSEWYFPARLTLDTGAVGNGLENPAQEVLDLHSTMGEHLPKTLHILAIDSELDKLFGGEQTTLTEAELLAKQSGIPESNLTLIEEKNSYAHNDPAGATPEINEFFKHMVPFLKGIAEE
jgi:pimeloyl-ACP methyl ester carboxylesterase